MKYALIFCVVFFLATGGHATVYKCAGSDGRVEFSDQPCVEGTGGPLELRDQSISLSNGALPRSSGRSSNEGKALAAGKKEGRKSVGKKKNLVDEERQQKAGERRFVHAGMAASEVRTRIGEPERKEAGDCGIGGKAGRSRQKACGQCWVYGPAGNDPQTQTRVCFDSHQAVSGVGRTLIR